MSDDEEGRNDGGRTDLRSLMKEDLDLSLSIPHNICLHLAPLPGFGVMYFCQENSRKKSTM